MSDKLNNKELDKVNGGGTDAYYCEITAYNYGNVVCGSFTTEQTSSLSQVYSDLNNSCIKYMNDNPNDHLSRFDFVIYNKTSEIDSGSLDAMALKKRGTI